MKISKKWLLDIFNIKDFDNKIFIENMIMSGFNVEKYYNFSNIDKIYTGKIIDIKKHPKNKKLFICTINVFLDKPPYQIITNVNKLDIGDIVPVALENSIFHNKIIIKKITLNDIVSYGTLCGINDLGLHIYDEPNLKYKDEIIIFDKNTKIGVEIKDILDINDTIFDIEVTNNRSDCYNAYGLAIEISSIMKFKLKSIKKLNINKNQTIKKFIKINKNLKKYINSYFFKIIQLSKINKTPRWLRRRLSVIEIIPENNFITDIINYIEYYYGYHIHIIKINKNNKIEVKYQNNDIVFLDKYNNILSKYFQIKKIEYNKDDILLLTNINIKPKFFTDFNNINNNYLLMKISNNIFYNQNYEKFISMIDIYLKNSITLFEDIFYKKYNNNKKINFNLNKINKILGTNINLDVMLNILNQLYFKYNKNNNTLNVPIYREDINNYNDIAEEVARIYGYNRIIEQTKSLLIAQNNFYKNYKFKNYICQLCINSGFNEIITMPFFSHKYNNILNIKIEKSKIVYIHNPLNEDNNFMRYTIIPSMFQIFNSIISKDQNAIVNIFELGKIYLYKNNNYLEKEKLCFISNNFKNILCFKEKILNILKSIDNINFIQSQEISFLHKYQQANIFSNNLKLGYIGKIHPKVASEMDLNSDIYIAEIDFNKLFLLNKTEKRYITLSKFPSIKRDLSLICDKKIPSSDIIKAIYTVNEKDLINEINLFDIYFHEKFGSDKVCLSFSITFVDKQKTLTDIIVENIIKSILNKLNNQYKIELRNV